MGWGGVAARGGGGSSGLALSAAHLLPPDLPLWLGAASSLAAGLVILNSACEVVVIATERFAARWRWDAYAAGTLGEILSTIPEWKLH